MKPHSSSLLTTSQDQDGVCSPGSSKTGIKLDSELDVEIDVAIEAGLGEDNKVPFNKKLFVGPAAQKSPSLPKMDNC